VTAYGKTLSNISIPLTIEQEDITRIGSSAFSGCDKLESIEIPSSTRSIGDKAFSGCVKLSGISIPFGVSSIEPSTFENCSSLSSVEMPDTVTSIGNYAFMGCKKLTEITIPSSMTYIGSYTFGDCSQLKTIVFPDSVESIGYAALYGCCSLQSLTAPFVGGCANVGGSNGVLGYVFGSEEFENALLVKQIFSDNSSNGSDFYLPSSLKSVTVTKENLSYGAFSGCSNLTEIVLGDGIRRIGEKAFYNCQGLIDIVICLIL
ncbi:MAG: leucine-rich repeat domain-containing protein, partial [Clostridia bacterium]|nr:leucine-rich repeat domain-containing protein [Clostridia bacterium]